MSQHEKVHKFLEILCMCVLGSWHHGKQTQKYYNEREPSERVFVKLTGKLGIHFAFCTFNSIRFLLRIELSSKAKLFGFAKIM